ncbi:hypothetical protein [Desertivirga arenae]|uniref:hypothetical protein n=1 Tax=Desertivirga arenae TaxID=2810309 RepID=UPI001A962B8D|nr:hypothetical protein [Pedobacter sp. SYSU D00823]
MKKLILSCSVILLLAACGINKQVEQLKAFEKCKYDLLSADSVSIANVPVMNLVGEKGFDYAKAPRLALALLRRDVPFSAKLNLKVTNPSADLAAINQFEYKILFKNHQLAEGLVNQAIAVEPGGGQTTVPIKLNSNIYDLLSDTKAAQDIADFITAGKSGKEDKGIMTIKIKPTIGLGGKKITYPGYITIDKEVSSKILL